MILFAVLQVKTSIFTLNRIQCRGSVRIYSGSDIFQITPNMDPNLKLGLIKNRVYLTVQQQDL